MIKYAIESIKNNIKLPFWIKIKKPSGDGFYESGDFIVGRVNGVWHAYDRVCDHAGGLLVIDQGRTTATCHNHKWTLNLSTGTYENSCTKNALNIEEFGSYLIIRKDIEEFEPIDRAGLVSDAIRLIFNAHASFSIEVNEFRLTTDPWFVGSCFATGWWHAYPPSIEAVERLRKTDVIYISHNHPDHLHPRTLSEYVPKDQLFLIPAFESKSVELVLRRHGFNNLIVANFLQDITFQLADGNVRVRILPSGDARDDSSLLFLTKDNSILFGVDTNMPNRLILPKVDVLFTSFSSGASGFPVRISNFSKQQKNEIIFTNKSSVLTNHVRNLVAATNPSYIVPYAGYFTEAPRDNDVKIINSKNTAEDLIDYLRSEFPQVTGINPLENPIFSIDSGVVRFEMADEEPLYFLDEEYIAEDINDFVSGALQFDRARLDALGVKFVNTGFYDELSVVIIPSDEEFRPATGEALYVNFSSKNRGYKVLDVVTSDDLAVVDLVAALDKNRIEILRVRSDILDGALIKGLPLEDLSIGFQVKMYRQPNVYNFKFWDYFTNKEFISW